VAVGVLAVRTAIYAKLRNAITYWYCCSPKYAAAGNSGCVFTNLPAIGLLLGSSMALGVTVVGPLTVLLRISLEISWEQVLAGAAGACWAAGWRDECDRVRNWLCWAVRSFN